MDAKNVIAVMQRRTARLTAPAKKANKQADLIGMVACRQRAVIVSNRRTVGFSRKLSRHR